MKKLLEPGDIMVCHIVMSHIDEGLEGTLSLVVAIAEPDDSGNPRVRVYEGGGFNTFGAELEYWEGWKLL